MRQAYATATPQPTSLPTNTPGSVMQTTSLISPSQQSQHQHRSVHSVDALRPFTDGTQRTVSGNVNGNGVSNNSNGVPSAITEVQQKLAAIQSRNGMGQNRRCLQEHQQGRGEGQERQRDLMYSAQHLRDNKLSKPLEDETSPVSPAISSTSSGSSRHGEFINNHPSGVTAPTTNKGIDNNNDDEKLTPQEMAFLRVVEFSAPLRVYAQLDPGSKPVSICDEAIAKLFPHHLVLVRPEGVAAVELVIEELCELNEDDVDGALDCILQPKGTSRRQLVRILCSDALARGALFKLISARRTLLAKTR
ncbi:putative antigenic protein [Trypanosoma theileri]|uniref:Putative antigenic protein n=1 Tax=Trypanosoma theileri TaxID=67003 RepID=A0A1X0P5T5_9TRYP|nr:putative antigenic protein [Trypanosoma theileri]ORC92292.1 putative antigenic protein [Trypanosoma theileri]